MPTKPYYLTTPIYYVNDVPHLGTAYTTILADVIARYRRALGEEAFFLTGTDEHGQKAQDAAAKRGIPPQQHCDELQQRFRDAWARLGVRYDDFIRTTEPRHVAVVQGVLSELKGRKTKRGADVLFQRDYEGWYHVSDEVFVTEKDIEEKALDRSRLVRLKETNWFFRMSEYQQDLVASIDANVLRISPGHRRNEVLGFLRKDLGDLCISRPKARLSWGIPLPFDPEYVTYVWFDALLNYVTAARFGPDGRPRADLWPADVHLIGKDILTTHAVYWPAMLLAAGEPLPREIVAHGWWVVGGTKMSKSLGNVVDPLAYADRYGVDPLRWFLIREMSVGQDAEFTDERFRARYDGDLGNTWGNLLSRTVTMIGRYADGRIPPRTAALVEGPVAEGAPSLASSIHRRVREAAQGVRSRLEDFALDQIAADAMDLFRLANELAERAQPWKAAKDPARAGEVKDVLYTLAEAVRAGSALLAPIVPTKAAEALRQLGAPPPGDLRAALRWGVLEPGTPVAPGPVLFPRIDVPA